MPKTLNQEKLDPKKLPAFSLIFHQSQGEPFPLGRSEASTPAHHGAKLLTDSLRRLEPGSPAAGGEADGQRRLNSSELLLKWVCPKMVYTPETIILI